MEQQKTNNEEKFIYTDSYKTKEQIWESYDGYLEHYTLYKTYKEETNYLPPEHQFGMNRHSRSLWIVINRLLKKDFEKTFEKDYEKIKNIMNKKTKEEKDYDYLMEQFDKFMYESGIKNVTITKEDLSTAIQHSR